MEKKISHVRITQLTNLLQSCIDKKSYLHGRILQSHFLINGLSPDIFLSNKLIEFYAKCGSLDHAHDKVFDKMLAINVYSWNATDGVYAKHYNLEDAGRLFVEMHEKNTVSRNTMISTDTMSVFEGKALNLYYMMVGEEIKPTHFTFTSVLSACCCLLYLEHGRRCHGVVVKVGFDENMYMYVENAMVGMYAKCGSMEEGIQIFDGMSQPNEVSFTSLMGGLSQTDRVQDAMRMFEKIHRNAIWIDPVALSSILGVCAKCEDGESSANKRFSFWRNAYGQQIHALVIKLGTGSSLHVGDTLIYMYAKCGDMDYTVMVFSALPEVNVVSWYVLIVRYGQRGHVEKAVEMLEHMQQFGFKPDEVTHVGMLGACVKSGDFETTHKMFSKMSIPSVASSNAILSGYCQKENHEGAFDLFRKM